jgi:hypothetical protein
LPEPNRVVITSCYGERFWRVLGPWVAHLEALNKWPIEVVSLDGHVYDGNAVGVTTFVADTRETKLQYGASDYFRLERILSHLGQDRDCIHVDLDVQMKRDFSLLCRLPYDFIVSRAFRFPPFALKRFGFVACTGFYIAKPAARHFCEALFRNIQQNTYQSKLDQYVLNAMLVVRGDLPRQETVQLDGISLGIDVFEYDHCSVAVLPKEAIQRNPDTQSSIFGNHHRSLIEEF